MHVCLAAYEVYLIESSIEFKTEINVQCWDQLMPALILFFFSFFFQGKKKKEERKCIHSCVYLTLKISFLLKMFSIPACN